MEQQPNRGRGGRFSDDIPPFRRLALEPLGSRITKMVSYIRLVVTLIRTIDRPRCHQTVLIEIMAHGLHRNNMKQLTYGGKKLCD